MNPTPRMNDDQLKQVRTLIKKRCCNYIDGGCILFDWSFCNTCPQWITYSLNCHWFRDAVLPNDLALQESILKPDNKRVCVICGNPLLILGPRSKYCTTCATTQRRKQQAEWAKKKRGKVSTF